METGAKITVTVVQSMTSVTTTNALDQQLHHHHIPQQPEDVQSMENGVKTLLNVATQVPVSVETTSALRGQPILQQQPIHQPQPPLNVQNMEVLAVAKRQFVKTLWIVVTLGMFVPMAHATNQLQPHPVLTLETIAPMTTNAVTVVNLAGTTTAHIQLQLLLLKTQLQLLPLLDVPTWCSALDLTFLIVWSLAMIMLERRLRGPRRT